jgi:hypothetical protein
MSRTHRDSHDCPEDSVVYLKGEQRPHVMKGGKPWYHTPSGRLYEAVQPGTDGDDPVVVKLSDEPKLYHSIWRDRAALQILKGSGVAPRVVPFSLTESFCDDIMVVMEHAGRFTLGDLQPGALSLDLLASIAVRGLVLLRELHKHGIVHGDIHWWNLVFSSEDAIAPTLRLIDFGRARPFIDPVTKKHIQATLDDPDKRLKWTPSLQSVYELRGSDISRRDDVFRFAELLINLVKGDSEIVHGTAKDGSATVPEAYSSKINRSLSEVHSTFAQFYHDSMKLAFDQRPDYEGAIEKFKGLLD